MRAAQAETPTARITSSQIKSIIHHSTNFNLKFSNNPLRLNADRNLVRQNPPVRSPRKRITRHLRPVARRRLFIHAKKAESAVRKSLAVTRKPVRVERSADIMAEFLGPCPNIVNNRVRADVEISARTVITSYGSTNPPASPIRPTPSIYSILFHDTRAKKPIARLHDNSRVEPVPVPLTSVPRPTPISRIHPPGRIAGRHV